MRAGSTGFAPLLFLITIENYRFGVPLGVRWQFTLHLSFASPAALLGLVTARSINSVTHINSGASLTR
jgi:hypothetical protein